jgi:hypothetical protein
MLRIAVPPSGSAKTNRYEAVNRILSISFERDPKEHVDVVLSANRRFMATSRSRYTWLILIGAIMSGAAIGFVMEVYRRYVLPFVLGGDNVPTLSMVLFQFLPFVLLIAGLILTRARTLERLRRKAFAAQLAKGQFIDTDIYQNGIETTSGDVTVWMPWHTVRDVVVANRRIEILGDAFVTYLPERAFPDKEIFHKAGIRLAELKRQSRIIDAIEDLNPDLLAA